MSRRPETFERIRTVHSLLAQRPEGLRKVDICARLADDMTPAQVDYAMQVMEYYGRISYARLPDGRCYWRTLSGVGIEDLA